MIGGSWGEEGRDVPRSVSREYFYKTCSEVKVMRSDEVKDTFSGREPSAKELMDAWVAKIDSMEDRCIEIEKDSFQLFDIWYVLHIDCELVLTSCQASGNRARPRHLARTFYLASC